MSVLQITKSMIALIYSTEVSPPARRHSGEIAILAERNGTGVASGVPQVFGLAGDLRSGVDRTSNAPSDQIDSEVGCHHPLTVPAH